ncbi:MAG: NADH-quinone oxidoreductase subunit N [Solirubrobacterales bacterium]
MADGLTIANLEQIRPVLVLVVTLGVVMAGALIGMRRSLLTVTLIGLIVAVVAALRLTPQPDSRFSQYLFLDPLYRFAIIFLCGLLAGVLLVSASLWKKPSWEWPVYLCMLVGSLIGMILLASSRHLIFFAVAFELASLPSYILVGFRRLGTKSAEGAAKYAIFGAVCSSVMVYGISLLYGATGTFDMQSIGQHLAADSVSSLSIIGLVCLVIGLGFKISLVPMHFWCPDAFEAAGADIAGWLSVASKSAALLAMARFLQILLPSTTASFANLAVFSLALIAIATMTLANLSAYWQTSVKRLLAYSSIAHAGYIVCGALVFSDAGGAAAIVAYILVYLLMNLGAFTVAGLVERQTGGDHLDNFAGLGARNPKLAAAMAIFLFSLVGLPPLAGFAVKWIILSALWQNQLAFVAVAILINTLLSLFYYMRIARAMYFADATHPATATSSERTGEASAVIEVPISVAAVLTVCAGGLLLLFLGWGLLNNFGRGLFGLPL